MKIALFSDVHGNRHALAAVLQDLGAWRPDRVIVNGDLVNRGPHSLECFERVMERAARGGWYLVRGNHESFVLRVADGEAETAGIDYAITEFTHWTRAQLGIEAELLRDWSDELIFEGPCGGTIHATHGSMMSNRHGVYEHHSPEEMGLRVSPDADLFLTAHTHKPHGFRYRGTYAVNSGSVGTPFDGDRRACYTRLRWDDEVWHVEHVRLPFDYAAAEADFTTSGFMDGGGPLTRVMLAEMVQAKPLIRGWMKDYEGRVRAGELALAESVERFLSR